MASNNPPTANLHAQVTNALLQKYSLPVSPTWLSANLPRPTNQGPTMPPLASLTQTALFRLLASDITVSVSVAATTTDNDDNNHSHNRNSNSNSGDATALVFPHDIANPNVKERVLGHDVPTQLLAVEDVGSSRWSQVEAMERVERGEAVRGREIVRSVDVDDAGARRGGATATGTGTAGSGGGGGGGPHKYVLQDAAGTKVVAFERERIEKLGLGSKECLIGAKMILKKGVVVRRGVLMLAGWEVTVLGGKVEAWDEAWRKGRKQELLNAVQENEPES